MSGIVVLIDAGTGNLRSVWNAVNSMGYTVELTRAPECVRKAGRVILPGVGAFGAFMQGLRHSGMAEAVYEVARRGTPLLGICVGMQALFDTGLEGGSHAGLGLLPGQVQRFQLQDGLKTPHTGWNQLEFEPGSGLFKGLPTGCHAYFNHSYFCNPRDPRHVSAVTHYGSDFSSAVMHSNLCGVQFHPEKSQKVGLSILKNFLSL